MGWTHIEEKMPKAGQSVIVLATCLSASLSNANPPRLRMSAQWTEKHTIEAHDEYCEEWCDWVEDDGVYYCPEGWYENTLTNDDHSSYYMSDFEVTHWHPMPSLPEIKHGTDVGDKCSVNGCDGVLQCGVDVRAIEGCSCHISPPCSACVADPAVCDKCKREVE